jgi:superkiller protein 3
VELPPIPEVDVSGFKPYSQKHINEAVDALRASPEDATTAGRLGMILHSYGLEADAEPAYRRARLLAPEVFRWAYLHGVSLSVAFRHDESIAAFQRAHELNPRYKRSRVRLVDEFVKAGDVPAAIALCQEVLESEPNSAGILFRLGRLQAQEGRTGEAIATFERTIEVAGPFGAVYYALAKAYFTEGKTGEAEQAAVRQKRYAERKLPVRDPLMIEVEAARIDAQDNLKRAKSLAIAGRLQEAIDEMKKGIDLEPGNAQFYSNLVLLYAHTGAYAYAERNYEAALAFDPTLALPHYNMGLAREMEGRHAEALEFFQKAIETDPRLADAYFHIAQGLARQDDSAGAERNFRKALDVDRTLRDARLGLASLYTAQGRHRDAIEELQAALTPEDAETSRYLLALAETQRKVGDEAAATESEERAAELRKEYSRFHQARAH